ncbi:MAG: hypothetical protein Q8N05_01780 [Bacteroidota bacterium]|nr:hypothetical protein [Bacteroidota bacterium]
MSKIFSLSISESKYFNDKQDKIEIVGCPRGGKDCVVHLSAINKSFLASSRTMRNKEYARSIEALKDAFYKTDELQDSSCLKCAELFRSTITQSLENIHVDLQKMTGGLFFRKRYQYSYALATTALEEFKKKI